MSAPTAAASALSFCDELGGGWNGQYCQTSVRSERNAVRDIKVAVPGDSSMIRSPGRCCAEYLSTLVDNWNRVGVAWSQTVSARGTTSLPARRQLSAVFRETYHADGPDFNNAYRTFTFDMSPADVAAGGSDEARRRSAHGHPPLAQPFVEQALNQAPPPHQPGTYPFIVDRWTPDKVYSGGYKAWALTPDELVLYMPDYPVAQDTPINFTPGLMQWSMDGGTVQAHIPLSALSPILRPSSAATVLPLLPA